MTTLDGGIVGDEWTAENPGKTGARTGRMRVAVRRKEDLPQPKRAGLLSNCNRIRRSHRPVDDAGTYTFLPCARNAGWVVPGWSLNRGIHLGLFHFLGIAGQCEHKAAETVHVDHRLLSQWVPCLL